MAFKIKTTVLKDLVAKSVKGCSFNKTLPITSLMAIELKNNKLALITTDSTNYLYMIADKIEGDDFYVVVQAEQFSKLISKTTAEYVSMELKEENLVVTGNGKYTIELPLNEEGELIKFPDPFLNMDCEIESSLKLSTFKKILNVNKSALATSLDTPCYTGYYFGDNVVSTDTYKICGTGISVFKKPTLISAEMLDLFECMSDENIEFVRKGNVLAFVTSSCVIYGNVLEGIEDYAIEPITGLLEQEFESMCKLPKSALLQVLDRLNLFVGVYDKNIINLTFMKDGLMISSKKSTGSELIYYTESENFKSFICPIDIEMFVSQLKSQEGEVVELWYGNESAIKLVAGNVINIIATSEEE